MSWLKKSLNARFMAWYILVNTSIQKAWKKKNKYTFKVQKDIDRSASQLSQQSDFDCNVHIKQVQPLIMFLYVFQICSHVRNLSTNSCRRRGSGHSTTPSFVDGSLSRNSSMCARMPNATV